MSAPIQCIQHITLDGERWDTIAWHYYGDPTAYGPIIEANPAVDIKATLQGGIVLLIPIMTLDQVNAQQANTNLPPWKQ
ncbi:MAG: tail protein X [Burkholderia sp.]